MLHSLLRSLTVHGTSLRGRQAQALPPLKNQVLPDNDKHLENKTRVSLFRLHVKEYDMSFTCESYTGGGGQLYLELVLAAANALSEIRHLRRSFAQDSDHWLTRWWRMRRFHREWTHREITNVNKSENKHYFALTVLSVSDYLAKNHVLPFFLLRTFVYRRPILSSRG